MKALLLNCDLGEQTPNNDALVMPLIDQANISCSLHAGDPQTTNKTIQFAMHHQVSIGAHPSYPDRENFGRHSMDVSSDELAAILHFQFAGFSQLCQLNNATLSYVKPHGALYNDMTQNLEIFTIICRTVHEFQPLLPIMVQALPDMTSHEAIANEFNLPIIAEAFADRAYQNNGLLVPRSAAGAVITSSSEIISNITHLLHSGKLPSHSGHLLPLKVDSICVHGDNEQALSLVKKLRVLIDSHG